MNNTSIADVNNMEAGDPIHSMRVTVKTAFKPDTGTSGNRTWQRQSAILSDETGEIRATFWNSNKDLRDLIGNDITLVSGKDKRGNFSGMVAEDYENKQGVTTRQISANINTKIDEVVSEDQTNQDINPTTTSHPNTIDSPYIKIEHEKRNSFERQKSLELAVAFGSGLDTDLNSGQIIEIAKQFYEFLSNGNGQA